jgi:hypothetical protein
MGIWKTNPIAKVEIAGGSLSMKWGDINIQRPVTTGGWARWLHYVPDNSVDVTSAGLAGMGVYGVAANQSSMYLAFGAAPWSSTRGIQILSNGNVGIGTATPAEKLDVVGW